MLFEKYIEELKENEEEKVSVNPYVVLLRRMTKLGFDDKYIYEYDVKRFIDILIGLKPKNIQTLSTYCSLILRFLEWCVRNNYITENDCQEFNNINRKELFNSIKNKVIPLITSMEYENTINDIEHNDDNPLYMTTLYMCLFEGIYSKNLYELKHLRLRDIDELNNTVRLNHEDGTVSYLKISPKLIDKLIELGNLYIWYRPSKSRTSYCEIKLSGLYDDSIFKTEMRNGYQDENSNTFRQCYYRRIRHINDTYLGKKVSPHDIYVSDIIHRVSVLSRKKGAEFNKYFNYKENNYDKVTIAKILREELNRLNNNVTVGEFMNDIKNYIYIF